MSAADEVHVRRWPRFAVRAGAVAVTGVAIGAAVARVRRAAQAERAAVAVPTAPAIPTAPESPAAPAPSIAPLPPSVGGGGLDAFPAFPAFAAFAALPDWPVVQAPDDRDTRGSGLPVPAEQAALELREENRFENAVFVRSVLILLAIALLLTARTIWVG